MAPRFASAGAERRGPARTKLPGCLPDLADLQAKRGCPRKGTEADDGLRTRDLRLGKPTLYQLSYVRVVAICARFRALKPIAAARAGRDSTQWSHPSSGAETA
jgi:hypothetical protein